MATDSHYISEEPREPILDGPSVNEADRADFTILTMVHETFPCRNNGCDEAKTSTHYYAYSDELQRHEQTCDIYEDSIPASAELVDYGKRGPIVHAKCPDCGQTWRLSSEKTTTDEPSSGCAGEPPRYDPR